MNPDDEKFFARVAKNSSGCWLWTGPRHPKGYGNFSQGKKSVRAHRYSYEMHVGPITDGLYVCHRCDVRHCVNPDHLFLGTNQDNVSDMVSKGRNAKGERHGSAKITEAEAIRIVILCSVISMKDVAAMFQINDATIGRILKGELWNTYRIKEAQKLATQIQKLRGIHPRSRAARDRLKEVLGA